MAEREPINPRKFKVWDTALLNEVMVDAAEVKHRLEGVCNKEHLPITEIKPTLIDSRMLYMMATAYLEAYEALVNENLLHIGSATKKLKPTIH